MTDPPPPNFERQIIALDRLRLLSLAYYISGAIGAAFVSFLLIPLLFVSRLFVHSSFTVDCAHSNSCKRTVRLADTIPDPVPNL